MSDSYFMMINIGDTNEFIIDLKNLSSYEKFKGFRTTTKRD